LTVNILAATVPLGDSDERSLLIRFELLLEREEEALAARDAVTLVTLAGERERLGDRLAEAARQRRARPKPTAAEETELIGLYQRLRHRHDVQARIVRRHAEQNSRALGVLAQATGSSGLYQADGSVSFKFVAI
jgi:flagellar biosynthesis/type III secretory pathway chaperone